MSLIPAHGGSWLTVFSTSRSGTAATTAAAALKSVTLSPREQCDLEMIAIGAFSPLTGFMGREDFDSVCKNMRLANGTVWPIPVTLCPPDEVAASIKEGDKLALKDDKRQSSGDDDGAREVPARQGARNPQRLPDRRRRPSRRRHRGKQGNTCLGGDIDVITPNLCARVRRLSASPAQTREAFAARGWQTVVGVPDPQPDPPRSRISHQSAPWK